MSYTELFEYMTRLREVDERLLELEHLVLLGYKEDISQEDLERILDWYEEKEGLEREKYVLIQEIYKLGGLL